jgi:hypothetical protein
MNNAGNWSALAPDGVSPSNALALADETAMVRFGADHRSVRLTSSTGGLDHTLRRSLPGLNITQFNDIRFWLRGNRLADGSPGRPFYLEVRLASAAMGLNDPGNTWRRFLPITQVDAWDLVILSLDNLPLAVRSAVNMIQFRCVNDSAPFVCFLDDLLAVREEMIGDAESALLALLNEVVAIDGNDVPAFITHPEGTPDQRIPSIRITMYDIQYVRELNSSSRKRRDYTATSFRMAPMSVHYDLYYFIDVYAETRQDKTELMEFVLRTLSPSVALLVNGMQLLLEWVTMDPLDQTGRRRSDRELLYFKVGTRQEVGTLEVVTPPYAAITLVSDQKP